MILKFWMQNNVILGLSFEKESVDRAFYAAAVIVPTAIRLSTLRTPGDLHAARSASSRSDHERTVPRRATLSPSAATLMWPASTSALRFRAASMAAFTSTVLGACF